MAHPLIAYLLASPDVVDDRTCGPSTTPPTSTPQALADLLEDTSGSTLGRQELEGEFIEALEGAILPRSALAVVRAEGCRCGRQPFGSTPGPLPRFDQIVHSWDTALKDKTTNDYVAGQVVGVRRPGPLPARVSGTGTPA